MIELETKVKRRFAKVRIVSYSRPSFMMIALASQFHVYLPWISSRGSSFFQLGEGPSRGLLRDYEPSDGPSFQALVWWLSA